MPSNDMCMKFYSDFCVNDYVTKSLDFFFLSFLLKTVQAKQVLDNRNENLCPEN